MAEASIENPGGAIDPITQFKTKPLISSDVLDLTFWGLDFNFTNANLMMVLGLLATFAIVFMGLGRNAGRVHAHAGGG